MWIPPKEVIHPMVVHIPIACSVLWLMFELVSMFLKKQASQFTIPFIVLAATGMVSAFAANFTGEIAEHAANSAVYHDLIEAHEEVAVFVSWTYLVLLVLSCIGLFKASKVIIAIRRLVAVALLGLVVVAASRGGELVYVHGIGTAASSSAIDGDHELIEITND